jgi:RecA/RadA recombinase
VARKKKESDEAKEEAEPAEVEAEEMVEETVEAPVEKKEKKEAPEKGAETKRKKKPSVSPDGFATFYASSQKKWPNTTILPAEAPTKDLPRMSTGNIGLDIATFGGWPRGRVTRLYGREKSAKTGTCLNSVVQWQKHCGQCYQRYACSEDCDYAGREDERPKAAVVWVDVEGRIESMWSWPEAHGVDLSRFLVMVPPDGQHVIDFVDAVIRDKGAAVGLIVIDSIAMVTSQEEIKKETTDGRTAPVNALLLNKGFRKWTTAANSLGVVDYKKPAILCINQIRLTMDQYHPEAMPGGEGQKYVTGLDVRFASGKPHYLVTNDDGEIEDRTTGYGTRWKPGEDDTPDFVEINYRVTASGTCLFGRFGAFNYWVKPAHGRRTGDPDNIERMWEYVKRLDLLQKEGRGYKLFDIEASTQAGVKEQFQTNAAAQGKVWKEIVDKLIDVNGTDGP